MNPNAKEFVPAHLLKKRQEEAVGELTTQISNVDIDDSKTSTGENGETSRKPESDDLETTSAQARTATSRDQAQEQNHSDNKQNNDSQKQTQDGSPDAQEAQHNASNNHHSSSNIHCKSNGDSNQDADEEDRYLLKAGENYCEFNGEQFIIPGEDDEYSSSGHENSHPGYDFGNAEDNEDEDVCNAYEEFLNDLPQ